jgi:hypothetical protein
MARAAVLAALLAGTAAMPAAAMADARASRSAKAEEAERKPDWLLLSVACVTFLIGRGAVQRRMKARSKPTP